MNVFDIIGPVMIGPSSSHTAGAARIGRIALALLGEPAAAADITLYGSFARTYRGHGTDRALVAGVLGIQPEDPRLRDSLFLARQNGLDVRFFTAFDESLHPNTARLELTGENGARRTVQAASIGGGQVLVTAIDGMPVSLTGEHPALVVRHIDVPGVIAAVAEEVSRAGVNICDFHLARDGKGGNALMCLEMEGTVDPMLVPRITGLPHVLSVTYLAAV